MSSSRLLIPKEKQGRAVCWEGSQAGLGSRRLSPCDGQTRLPHLQYLLCLPGTYQWIQSLGFGGRGER